MEYLKEGDIIELEKGHKIYAKLPKAFICDNGDFDFSLHTGEVKLGIMQRGLDTSILLGEYIVVKTVYGGGGTAMGPHDVYPDGHKVYAKKLTDGRYGTPLISEFEVSFYQSGCFTCMIQDIKPIRRAKIEWNIKEKE